MRRLIGLLAIGALAVAARPATAQGPGGGPERALSKSEDVEDLVSRMLAFDKDQDGKLSRDEVTDERLHRLFDRADADKDGVVTKDELAALAAREHSDDA